MDKYLTYRQALKELERQVNKNAKAYHPINIEKDYIYGQQHAVSIIQSALENKNVIEELKYICEHMEEPNYFKKYGYSEGFGIGYKSTLQSYISYFTDGARTTTTITDTWGSRITRDEKIISY